MYNESYMRGIQSNVVDVQAQLDSDASCAPLQGKLWACLRAIWAQTIVNKHMTMASLTQFYMLCMCQSSTAGPCMMYMLS